ERIFLRSAAGNEREINPGQHSLPLACPGLHSFSAPRLGFGLILISSIRMSETSQSVTCPRVKHIQRKRKDRIKQFVKQEPGRDNSYHAECGVPDELQKSDGGP